MYVDFLKVLDYSNDCTFAGAQSYFESDSFFNYQNFSIPKFVMYSVDYIYSTTLYTYFCGFKLLVVDFFESCSVYNVYRDPEQPEPYLSTFTEFIDKDKPEKSRYLPDGVFFLSVIYDLYLSARAVSLPFDFDLSYFPING